MKLASIAAACILCTTSIVFANSEEKVVLDEITVTGGKLEKNLQETVTSIQVFDETFLNNSSSLNDMYNLFEQTSNVNRSGKYSFNIRGINATGITGSYAGPRTINVSVDGVSIGSNASKQGAISTWDMEQAEIMKGPQSTTQGRNSLAGAVVLKTKDPEFEANGAAQLNVGTDNNYQLSAMQTGAITDNLAIRLSLDKKSSDGFTVNEQYRDDAFNEKSIFNARTKFLYEFDNEATLLLTLSKLSFEEEGSSVVQRNGDSTWNTDGYYDTDAVAHSLDFTYPVNNNWSFKSLTSYTNEDLIRVNDTDYLNGDSITYIDRENYSISQEFRLNYEGDNSKSIIGLYYSKGEADDDSRVEDADASSLFTSLVVDYQEVSEEDYTNSAIFFNTDYYLNDKLTLLLGARLDRDTRFNSTSLSLSRVNDYGVSAINSAVDATLAGIEGNNEAKNKTINFMPKIGFNYKLSDDINTGFIYSKGYRPGGMSTNPISGIAKEYEAEETDNIELSFKSQWLEKRLTFNTNVFYTKWKEQQVYEQGDTSNIFDVYTVNAGKSTLKGIELDTKFKLNNEVDLYGNIAYSKAIYDDYVDGDTDNTGNYLKKTPKVAANIGANYRNNEGYFVGGNISYTGSQYGDSENTRKIDAFTVVNVKTGYEEKDWAIYLYANNLFDNDYVLNSYSDEKYELGDSRVVGFNLKYYW